MIFQAAQAALEVKAACLYLVDRGNGRLIPVAQQGLSEKYFRSKKSLLAPQILERVEQDGFFATPEVAADPQIPYPEAKQVEGLAAILAAPVRVKGHTLGLFCLFTAEPRKFNHREREFAAMLAQQAGGVMEHGRLIDELRAKTRVFFDLAVNLSGSLEIPEIMHALTVDVAQALGVKAASIRLLNDRTQTLELVASHGLSDQYLQKGPVSAKKSIAQALNGKQPVVIPDAATDRRVQYRKMNQEEGIATILSVPITTKDRVIGVLRLYTAARREFTADEIMLVSALGGLGGLAIQNASLYLRCQEDMKELMDELWSHRSWF
jgi:GAF domain-containing protein